MILIGFEGPDATTRAKLSRALAKLLRESGEFSLVNNGDSFGGDRDRAILFNHRYVLSPLVSPERFSVSGLRNAIGESIDLLASPAGLMLKTLLPRDPTGELLRVLSSQDIGALPSSADGVWASRDGARAVLIAQTRASGSDTDGQQHALTTIKLAWDHALASSGIGQPGSHTSFGPGSLLRHGARDHTGRCEAAVGDWRHLHRWPPVGGVSLTARARPGPVAGRQRRPCRRRGGESGIRHRPRNHVGIRNDIDRRGSGLLDLLSGPVFAEERQSSRRWRLDRHVLADNPVGNAHIGGRLLHATVLGVSWSCATWALFRLRNHCRGSGNALRTAAAGAGRIPRT